MSEVLEATSFTIWAPRLAILSSSAISLATVTPSLVTVGEPQDFSIRTLRPRGPSVTLTVFARTLSPSAMRWRAFSEKTISLADMDSGTFPREAGQGRPGHLHAGSHTADPTGRLFGSLRVQRRKNRHMLERC